MNRLLRPYSPQRDAPGRPDLAAPREEGTSAATVRQGDLSPLMMCSVLAILLLESWLFHPLVELLRPKSPKRTILLAVAQHAICSPDRNPALRHGSNQGTSLAAEYCETTIVRSVCPERRGGGRSPQG